MKPWELSYCIECDEIFKPYDPTNPACPSCTNRNLMPLSAFMPTAPQKVPIMPNHRQPTNDRRSHESSSLPFVSTTDIPKRGFVGTILQDYIRKARNALCQTELPESETAYRNYRSRVQF